MADTPIWLVALPLAGALAALLLPRLATAAAIVTGLLTTVAAGVLLFGVATQGALHYEIGGWTAGLGIMLRADGLSTLLLLMTALVVLAASIYASTYFRKTYERARFWPLWLLLWTSLNALLLSGDLFNIYVTLELLGLSAVALASLGGKRAAVEAALRYLLVGLLGSMLFLAGVGLIYAGYGTLDLTVLARVLEPGPVAWPALALMSSGLLLKTALFPLHFWLPPAHASAPAPVSAVLSALVVKAAFYLVLRLWLDVFANVITPASANLLGLLGAGAVLWGSWQALRAERLKLLAAYSTVAQLGYLFLFFPLLLALPAGPDRDLAAGGLAMLALTHGFAKAGLFLAIGIIQQRCGHDTIRELDGTAQHLPATTFAIALAGVALVGLPPSGAFLGKWQLLAGAVDTGQWWWLVVTVAGSLLAAAYIFRVLGHAFGHRPYPNQPVTVAREEWPALLLSAMAALVLGLAGAPVWGLLEIST
ncbi:MAG: oxidoreductase [Gammaproteobacteria bacterium]|jgi:formate hydrogenlyase subunit 3/multisubunit Na+/H+ antiporter MnhD subunit|nr:oxidoreductase [Gammaproteobacteria bacterium]